MIRTFACGNTSVFNNGGVPLNWDTSNVVSMAHMFSQADGFNQDLSLWDTSKVTDMSNMFTHTDSFNNGGLPLTWDTSNVRSMDSMFASSKAFDQDISNWDVGNVLSMKSMFGSAQAFNNGGQALAWADTGAVTDVRYMFNNAAVFNVPVDSWDIRSMTNMYAMFHKDGTDIHPFNQSISGWNNTPYNVASNLNLNLIFDDNASCELKSDLSGFTCTCSDPSTPMQYCGPLTCGFTGQFDLGALPTSNFGVGTCTGNETVGQTCTLACLPGFIADGNLTMTCESTNGGSEATYMHTPPGVCRVRPVCESSQPLLDVMNAGVGIVLGLCTDTLAFDETCTLACAPGLIADGDFTVACNVDQANMTAEWILPQGTCNVVDSDSSKDEAKYIILFVGCFIVLSAFVAGGLYMAGCIGTKAGGEVSALPTKAPVKAVEFTTSQETA
jgi:surface protein